MIFLLSGSVNALASGVIRGVIIDYASRKPMYGVNLYFPDFDIGTVSDEKGEFELRVQTPFHGVMEVSFIGYESKRITIDLNDGESKEMTIYLNPGALRMDEIQVVGDRVKQTVFESTNFVSIKTAEDFVQVDRKTTADVLREEPGILVQKTTHAHGAPIIRGLIGRYVLLLYNGIRLNRPTYRLGGNQYLNTVSAEALHRIEVTRGPTSVLYGSDAIGGTVNLVTERFESERTGMRVYPSFQTGYSSADDGKYASLSMKGSKNIVSFSGSLSFKDIGNLRPGDGMDAQDPTGWEEVDGSFNLFIEPSPRNTFEINYLNTSQSDVPRYDKYATGKYEKWIYDPQTRQLLAASYIYTPPMSWLHQVKINVSYQQENEGKTQQKTGSSKLRYDEDKMTTIGSFIQFSSIVRNKHWLNWGAEYYHDRLRSSRLITQNGETSSDRPSYPDKSLYDSFGVYLQDNFELNEKTEVGVGLRYSYFRYESPLEEPWGTIKDPSSDITGSLSISYKPTEKINLVGSYARGFQAPNFNETVVLQYSNYGVDAPNPNLEPETSHNFEIGLKIEDEKTKGGFFIFYNRMSDLIDRREGTYNGLPYYDENDNGVQDPEDPLIYQKFNLGKAYIYGSEMFGSYRFDPFVVSGQLAYTYGENTTVDEPMSRIPPLMARLGLQWYPNNRMWFEVYSRFATKQDRLSARDIEDSRIPDGGTPEYFTLNFRSIFNVSANKIVVRFENLFDELYKEHGSGIYSPGRNVSVMYQFTPVLNWD